MRIGVRTVNDVEPKDRDIAMVFRNYALYPHMTVYDNIGFALELSKVPKDEIDQRVRKAAEILELTANLDRKPGQLSGGQRQRVRPHASALNQATHPHGIRAAEVANGRVISGAMCGARWANDVDADDLVEAQTAALRTIAELVEQRNDVDTA